MNIEHTSEKQADNATAPTGESKLQNLIDTLFKGLKNLNERKDNTEMASLTSLLKKASKMITEQDLRNFLDKSECNAL